MLCRIATWRLLNIVGAVVLFTALTASAQVTCTSPACVAGGSDYFQTTAASVTLPDSLGFGTAAIPLISLPNDNEVTAHLVDTIIQRQEDAGVEPTGGTAIPSLTWDLSLLAPAVLNTGNGFEYNLYVTLDRDAVPVNMGMITINGNATGGTYTTCTNVYLQVSFMPTNGGPPIATFTPGAACTLGNTPPCTTDTTPYPWSSTPPTGAYLLTAVYPAFNANQHTSSPPLYVPDFYPTQTTTQSCSVGSFTFMQTTQLAQASSTALETKPTQSKGRSEGKVRK